MDALWAQVKARLEAHAPRAVNLPGLELREAAVLVPLRLHGGVPHLLFTVRPATLRSHAGQVSFPGGARDASDPTPLHAALREAEEELGIPQSAVTVLGQLDETPTTSAFRIAPFVGAVQADLPLSPSPDEVAEVFEVPLGELLAPGVHRTERRGAMGREWEVDFYPWGGHTIWGATARIVRNLLTRVADMPELHASPTRTP
ncbi:MAG: CoA pyrophosphatase [Myxococcaceae bacterium]|nr:CoA pyrophosphatase [Myxococcaceae bacterium]MCI0672397.1 CoA pyrophosphatase [Myxococcaceae bacterium]